MKHALRNLAGVARKQPAAAIGLVAIFAIVMFALLVPITWPYGAHSAVGGPFGTPSLSHPLGLDDMGVDVVALLASGARMSVLVGVLAGFVAMAIGGSVGLLAGYCGKSVDMALMAVTDYFLVVPVLPLGIIIAALWGPNLRNVVLIISILSWMTTARLVRAMVMALRERIYVRRARCLGASNLRILLRHILPAVSPLLVASLVISVGNAIFFEAALSFLGLGDPSRVSWGTMISNAFNRGAVGAGAWWAIVPPGVAIGIVVLGTSLVGRALEDSMNPRLNASHLSVRRFSKRGAA
jgi:peptide/nickel transport system permease protein